jgi:hypothetical protein
MTPKTTAIIFSRLWDGDCQLTMPVARHILKLRFSDSDLARMRELAERNREGQLSPAELDELDSFVTVGDLLAMLQSKARRLVKPSPLNSHVRR